MVASAKPARPALASERPADADAHGGERELAAALFQPMHRRQRKPRARHAERMAERDRAAVRIDVLGVVGERRAGAGRPAPARRTLR